MFIQEIKKLVEDFVENTIGDNTIDKMCFNLCFPLLLHLSNNKIKCHLKSGVAKGIQHYILGLDNFDPVIIDPTFQQIYPEKEKVYIGQFNDYNNFRIIDDNEFKQVYNNWLKTLCNNGISYEVVSVYPFKQIQVENNIEIMLKILMNSVKILYSESNQIKNQSCFEISQKHILYLEAYKKATKIYHLAP